MSIKCTPEQDKIRENLTRLCPEFEDEYWLQRDADRRVPEEFYRAIADNGYVGIAIPIEYGGSGIGITEAVIPMQTISQSGAENGEVSSVSLGTFGLNPIVRYSTEEQSRRMLPPVITRQNKACFAVTEPDACQNAVKAKRGPLHRKWAEDLDQHRVDSNQDPSHRPDNQRGTNRSTNGRAQFVFTDFDR